MKDWIDRLEDLEIKPGMKASVVLGVLESRGYGGVVMPTVSITFWLISEDLHYISNSMFTSLDYYYYVRGYDHYEAFPKMLEDPLAIVKEHTTILIKSEDLAKSLSPINVTRALEKIRRELGLIETTSSGVASNPLAWRGCPPGTKTVSTGVCEWENYWGFSENPA